MPEPTPDGGPDPRPSRFPPTKTPSPGLLGPQPITAYFDPPAGDGEVGRFGYYRVVKQLGEGGMGLVFLAEDTRLERPVALKFMAPNLAVDEKARARFLREARTAAKVNHEHVVTVFEVHEINGLPYIAMERLKGMSLDDFLQKKGTPGLSHVLRIGREIAAGLKAAHAVKLVHRDIKPSNVWLEAPSGKVKLLDFGLAFEATADARLTVNGAVVGTPEYMAPEQARGEDVDARADLFSLGVVLYQLATGQRPFARPSQMAVLAAVLTVDPPPVRSFNPSLPAGLEDLIRRLMAKDPAGRPPSAAAVIAELSGPMATDSIADLPAAEPMNLPQRPSAVGGRPPSGVVGGRPPGSGAHPPAATPYPVPLYAAPPTAPNATAPTHISVPPGSHPGTHPPAAYPPAAYPAPGGQFGPPAVQPPPSQSTGLGVASIVCGGISLLFLPAGCCFFPAFFVSAAVALAGGGMALFARGGERVIGITLNGVALVPAAIMTVLGASLLAMIGLGAAVGPPPTSPATGKAVLTKATSPDPFDTVRKTIAPDPTTKADAPKTPDPYPAPTGKGFTPPPYPTNPLFPPRPTTKGFAPKAKGAPPSPDGATVERTITVNGTVPAWERGMEITLDRVEMRSNYRMRWHFTFWNRTGVKQQLIPSYPRNSVAIDDKGNRCNGLEDSKGAFGRYIDLENGEKVTYWFDFQNPAADATAVTASFDHSLNGKLPKLTVKLADGTLVPPAPNLVLRTKFPIVKGADVWVEVDGARKADWPVGTSQVELLLPQGSRRVAVYSVYQTKKTTVHSRFETIPADGKREIDVGP